MKMNRREVLKLSAGALITVLASPFISAQSAKVASPAGGSMAATKVDGNISYNAGWVVPLEDKAPLLELEARKTKERDDMAKQKAGTSSDSIPSSKDNTKSISSRIQGFIGRLRGWF